MKPAYHKLNNTSIRFPDYREGDNTTLVLYTDGGARFSHNINNDGLGKGRPFDTAHCVAGAGVYLANDGTCYTAAITGTQTNNRAELTALWIGLLLAQESFSKPDSSFSKAIIKTDSKYSIDIFTDFVHSWRKNRGNVATEPLSETTGPWRRSTGDPVLNQDLIYPISQLFDYLGSKVELQKVKGHMGIDGQGNENADDMALLCIMDIFKKKNLPLGGKTAPVAGKKKCPPPKKNLKLRLGFL